MTPSKHVLIVPCLDDVHAVEFCLHLRSMGIDAGPATGRYVAVLLNDPHSAWGIAWNATDRFARSCDVFYAVCTFLENQ